MGLFSIFGKKDLEAEQKLLKKIEELEQTIARKDKEISDLINELDRVNQSIPNTNTNTNLNSKQLELIEKNIKDTKEENDRLKQVIDEYNLSSKKEKYYYKVDIEKLLDILGQQNICSILVEGGATLSGSFVAKKLVDKVYFFIAPKIIGGKEAKTPVAGTGILNLQEALALKDIQIEKLEEDVLIIGRVDKDKV